MKNYVKEFDGQSVPKGSKYYSKADINQKSYFYDKNCIPVGDKSAFVIRHSDLTELPEAPQEWNGEGLPPVGVECIINITEDVRGLSDQELKLNGEKVSVISNVKNKRGFDVTVFEISEGGVFCFSSKLFRPLKTQQEKDREAFVELGMSKLGAFHSNRDFLAALFDNGARFTVPKASDNE